jgi:hypothetical protein
MTKDERQEIIDGEHLKILSICYYIYAGFNALFSLFGLFYALMGLMIGSAISRMPEQPNQPPPAFFAVIFGVFGLGMFVFLIVLGLLKFMVAGRLRRRRSRVFCMIVAGVSCVGIPFGTVMGVFTLIVLSRPSVKRLFDTNVIAAPDVIAGGGEA